VADFRIACAQTIPVPGDVAANVGQHLDLVRTAATASPEVIVFPELSLTGYELGLAAELAFETADARLAPLRLAAREGHVSLVVGAPIRLGDGVCNGAFIFLPTGETLVHTKRFLGSFGEEARVDGELPPPEPSVFVPGELAPLVSISGGLAAVAICAEGNRPEHARAAAARGAVTYLAGSFVIPSEYEEATRNLHQRAMDHRMLVAFANFGGPSGGLRSAGGSAIWSPDGRLLGKLATHGAGVLVAIGSSGTWTIQQSE
jgi:predicted amidohydrolase